VVPADGQRFGRREETSSLDVGATGLVATADEKETGVCRETASAYLRRGGNRGASVGRKEVGWPPNRPPREGVHRLARQNRPPRRGVHRLSVAEAGRAPAASAWSRTADDRGGGCPCRNAMAIWQDLVDDHGLPPATRA